MLLLRLVTVVFVTHIATGVSTAATPKEIDNAIQLGVGYLKDQYKNATPKQVLAAPNGIGAAALAGLALLECSTPQSDPGIRTLTAVIRDASFTTTQTYHIALCILYLDKLGDPSDVPLIQMLGVRLLAGQDANGGWTYECIESVPLLEERELRRSLLTADLPPGNKQPFAGGANNPVKNPPAAPAKAGAASKLNPDVERYQVRLGAVRIRARIVDNSNTQFGILGLWVARKHGVQVETAFDSIEKRFLTTQTSNGGWAYAGSASGSPSMTCAGLLGLATAIGRKEEQRLQGDTAKPGSNPKAGVSETTTQPSDSRSNAVQKGLSALGTSIAGNGPGPGRGKGPRLLVSGATLGDRDLYFMWSVERVGVIFGLDKIGGINWYEVGAEDLIAAQNISGSWGRGGRGAEVDTAFALLFLVRSNPVKDLAKQVQMDATTTAELRTDSRPNVGDSRLPGASAKPVVPVEPTESRRPGVIVIRPNSPAEDPKALAAELVGAMGLEWDTLLTKARDAKATAYTQAIVLAIGSLEGDRLKQARGALIERLTRSSPESLRATVKGENAELRRAAVLAMTIKDDKKHIPDLIDALLDEEEFVVRAAQAGLKVLAQQDFGPKDGASNSERKAAVAAWREWFAKQKK
jgi:hypothetical protein